MRICTSYLLSTSLVIMAWAPVLAEVTPDGSLGKENSFITPSGNGINLINGGAQRGNNLFHSFSQFNIGNGQNVYFSNPTGVQNIMTRVTGGNASTILGTLGVNGAANLFLINPSGIIFGKDARLDVRGSFVGTTANKAQFGEQGFFSATNPEAPALLTVNPSALLYNQINPQPIQSQAETLVNFGNSLLLVGGAVNLNKSAISNPGGRVELGGLSEAGTVGLIFNPDGIRLDFPKDTARADTSIVNNSAIDVVSNDKGNISLYGRNIDISETTLQTGINELATANSQAGNISINATGAVSLTQANLANIVAPQINPNAVVQGGDIIINANSLSLKQNSGIGTVSLGQGDAGNIIINTRDAITAEGGFIGSTTNFGAVGKAGNVDINTGSLFLKNGSVLSSVALGQGASGNITINSRDTVVVDAQSPNGQSSAILSTLLNSEGKGGDIKITTSSLYVTNGAAISSASNGKGDAGNLQIDARDTVVLDGMGNPTTISSDLSSNAEGKAGDININTGSLFVKNAGFINSNTYGKGSAGNININARNEVVLDGANQNIYANGIASGVSYGAKGEGGNIRINADTMKITNQTIITTSSFGGGDAGDIIFKTRGNITFANTGGLLTASFGQVNAGKVLIDSGGTVSFDRSGISSGTFSANDLTDTLERSGIIIEGLQRFEPLLNLFPLQAGSANDIEIKARSLRLDNGSTINSFTTSGNGGNIRLQLKDVLLLRRLSSILTTAGLSDQGGNGGNITIDVPFIVAVDKEDSGINANAFTGNGGNINIKTRGLFGIQARSEGLPNSSDITASSTLGVQGQILIQQPEVQPTQAIIELPEEVVDATRQVVQICPRGPGAKPLGEFTIIGRGSLPPNPLDMMPGTTPVSTLATLEGQPTTKRSNMSQQPQINTPIIEAQGWVKTGDGSIELVSMAPNVTPSQERAIKVVCPE